MFLPLETCFLGIIEALFVRSTLSWNQVISRRHKLNISEASTYWPNMEGTIFNTHREYINGHCRYTNKPTYCKSLPDLFSLNIHPYTDSFYTALSIDIFPEARRSQLSIAGEWRIQIELQRLDYKLLTSYLNLLPLCINIDIPIFILALSVVWYHS